MTTMTKVMTTRDLRKVTETALERHYNRILTDEAVELLDPNGIHVVRPLLIHEHAQGKPVDPHMRARVYMKYRTQEDPVEATIDVDLGVFDHLMTVDELKAAQEASDSKKET